MILEVHIRSVLRYASTWPDMAELIDEVMTTLATEDAESPWIVPGEVAYLQFVEDQRPDPHRPPWPDNCLAVAVNNRTGYGGLTWCVTPGRINDDPKADCIWVTDNPTPPPFDPRVVSDVGIPSFYHPSSTLPTAQIRIALEEFCRSGTGDRPESVRWVHGELNGQRHDAAPNIGIKRRPRH